LDSLFSHLQRAMRWSTLCSVADVADVLSQAITKQGLQPVVCVMEYAVSWSLFFHGVVRGIHGHSGPLEFRFFRALDLPDSPSRMLHRTTSEHSWEGIDRTAEPVQLMTALPRGLPKRKPLRSYSPEDTTAVMETIHAAEKGHAPLIHPPEAASPPAVAVCVLPCRLRTTAS
jgi:hypothetical protein